MTALVRRNMGSEQDEGRGEAVAGLIVGDGIGGYFAIAWAELEPYRVPAPWVAPVAALVHGAELAGREDDLRGHGDARPLSAEHALLLEALSAGGRLRLAAQRLEVWALLR